MPKPGQPFEINIEGVNFRVSSPNPAPDDGNKWVVVHPATIKQHIDPLESADPELFEPAGYSSPRVPRGQGPIAIAGGTDPEGGLDPEQSIVARKVALAVELYFNVEKSPISAQRYAPGEAEPTPYDLHHSQEAFVGAPVDKIPHGKLSMEVQAFLQTLRQNPALLPDLDEKEPIGKHTARHKSAPAAKGKSRPLSEIGVLDSIMDVINANAPVLEGHPEQKKKLAAGITTYIMGQLDTLRQNLTDAGVDLKALDKRLPPRRGAEM